jgi:acyl transferase domain-containing protein
MAVDTACSSALVAVHLACQSIWTGQARMALAGGVNALFNPYLSIAFSRAGMLSPSGQCFAFDHRADGYVRSEGVGIVVIELLQEALAQGHRIYALIRAAVVNQDGHTSSLTVPGLSAQEDLLHRAYQAASVAPGQVAYVRV